MKNIFKIFLVSLMGIAVWSCSNYRLAGTPTELPFKSVYVMPVKNTAYIAQATNLLTNSISEAINQVPNLRTEIMSHADATLETKIVSYQRKPVVSSGSDTALAAAYEMEAVAECTLTRTNGDVIFKNRRIKASARLYTNSNTDLIGNEYQNMPVLMRELGGKIKDAVIGIW